MTDATPTTAGSVSPAAFPGDVDGIVLNDGKVIPQLGYGLWEVPAEKAEELTLAAFEAGIRHIDTAMIYKNEEGVGRAIAQSGLPRDEIFVTTKLWNDDQGAGKARPALEASLERLGLDYVDLYLIHWSMPKRGLYLETWEQFPELREAGLTTSIGVSNFNEPELREIIETSGVTPVVNQIELHPKLSQAEMRTANAGLSVVTEAWSPLGRGENLQIPEIVEIAQRHDRSPAQVIIRWLLQLGVVVFPRSTKPERIRENASVTDFELTDEEVATLTALDAPDGRLGKDPADFN